MQQETIIKVYNDFKYFKENYEMPKNKIAFLEIEMELIEKLFFEIYNQDIKTLNI